MGRGKMLQFKDIKGKIPISRIEFYDSKRKNAYFIDNFPKENLEIYSNLEFISYFLDERGDPVLRLQLNSEEDFKVINTVIERRLEEKLICQGNVLKNALKIKND